MKHFRITSTGQNDLDEIWLFIAQESVEAADKVLDLLFLQIVALAKHPLMGRLRDDLRKNVRGFPVGNYVIFYRDAPEHIEIVRVLHGARDLEELL